MTESLRDRRDRLLGVNVPTFYDDPLEATRADGVWIQDASGRKYLDCYNNTAHIGHGHPRVVEAVHRQMRTLNVHSRYINRVLLDYLDRLTGLFSHDLKQVLMACTGSEANDVALRMAQAATGGIGIVATDNTYHGNTLATAALSTRRPPIGGRPPHVRLVPAPRSADPAEAPPFADAVAQAADELREAGFGPASLIVCPVLANEGVIAAVPGLFGGAAAAIRDGGGLVICDEVQPGFARVGSHWWGHDAVGLAPDIVTLGKPMANGHPVAAVVTRPDVMTAFREAFGYFNTYAGTPVAAAAAMAVLDALEGEDLAGNGRRVGYHLRSRLESMTHPLVADRRSAGLFAGVEIAGPRRREIARAVVEGMKARGVLIGSVGRDQHVLKVRPPLSISRGNVDLAITAMTEALGDAGRLAA